MGWLFGNVALCEESPESAKAEPAKKEDAPKAEAKENSKSESTSAESEVKSGPKNTGDDPEIDAKETEKAVAQEEGKAQASSGEGMAEPVSVRKFSHEYAKKNLEEHKAAGGKTRSTDVPEPEDEEHIQVKTVPYDPRFPATNQARNCYTRYNEYYKCIADKDEDASECKFYQRAYRSLCPSEWVVAWNDAREEGTWFGKY